MKNVSFRASCFAVLAACTISAMAEQRVFHSPQQAMEALVNAAKSHDRQAIDYIFGPNVTNLLTGDEVLDQSNFNDFTRRVSERCQINNEIDGKATLQIGSEGWNFPIPIVRTNGAWIFDTLAGEDEVINRHIGRNEYYAIGVCRAYVKAQPEYNMQTARSGMAHYASKFRSRSEKDQALDTVTTVNNSPRRLSSIVGQACLEKGTKPQPFHGYCFRILTKQGGAAKGGARDYMEDDELRHGFGLVAFPVRWGESGVMTFIVNEDGTVYEKDLGPETTRIASSMKEYNPDPGWKVVNDSGVTDLAGERKD
jgi:hypothetical protein